MYCILSCFRDCDALGVTEANVITVMLQVSGDVLLLVLLYLLHPDQLQILVAYDIVVLLISMHHEKNISGAAGLLSNLAF